MLLGGVIALSTETADEPTTMVSFALPMQAVTEAGQPGNVVPLPAVGTIALLTRLERFSVSYHHDNCHRRIGKWKNFEQTCYQPGSSGANPASVGFWKANPGSQQKSNLRSPKRWLSKPLQPVAVYADLRS
jgi:hypothetical protein